MGSSGEWYRLTAAELNGRLARLCYEHLVDDNPYAEQSPERREFTMGWIYVDKHPEFLKLNKSRHKETTIGGNH